MKPGAVGFIHHSNLGHCSGELTDEVQDWESWRGRDMTFEKFAGSCESAGLACMVQEIIPWASDRAIDCYSTFTRPMPGQRTENRVFTNERYWQTVWALKDADEQYKLAGERCG